MGNVRAGAFLAIWLAIWVSAWLGELLIFPESNGIVGGAVGIVGGLVVASLVTGVGRNTL